MARTDAPRRGGLLGRLVQRHPRLEAWWSGSSYRPLLRVAFVGGVILVGDAITWRLISQDRVLDAPIVTAVRLVGSLLILRYPLAGFLLMLELDKWDYFWLGIGTQGPAAEAWYQVWDKCVDLAGLSVAAAVAWRWPDRRARGAALFAFAWRAVGVGLFLYTRAEWLLLPFPNVFESIYLVYTVAVVLFRRTSLVRTRGRLAFLIAATLIPKMGQEVFLHVLHAKPWLVIGPKLPPAWVGVEAYGWGALLYGPLVVAAIVLGWTGRRPLAEDPELEISVSPPESPGV